MQVAIIGGGMITHDQILPTLYDLQRNGVIGDISVCASRRSTVETLAAAETLLRAFPGQSFRAYPDAPGDPQPELYKQAIADLPPRNLVVVATPDQLHYQHIMTALRHDQHVLAVKPLVLRHAEAVEIEKEAWSRGLLVGIEYHKRFDDRALMARRKYRAGQFGEFVLGTACLLEKWYYRHSNFQNWCTTENSDAFTYIGCHYVDQVHFITGLLPVRVSVYGIVDQYPNGNSGYLWTDARVIFDNGACLNVQNALGFPDDAPGTNIQGIVMYTRGKDRGGLLAHSDTYRGLSYCYMDKADGAGGTTYAEPSPDYFQYVDLGGPGLQPVGYGYRSIANIVKKCMEVESAAPVDRAAVLRRIDETGVIATPANSAYNELVMEAGRASILNGGREVTIEYGERPGIRFSA
ncbi:MAG: Gfo/Idh/MocA family oxidoreductase [Bryobacterales bacterium]|nr:Gfo/Idh/MocA family oxidoreductase [Bryobacterales bacterium]